MNELELWIAAGVVGFVLLGWRTYQGYKAQVKQCAKDKHWLY